MLKSSDIIKNNKKDNFILKPEILQEEKPLYLIMKDIKEITFQKIKPKYDLILDFINKSFNLNLKSLRDFKKYDYDDFNIDLFEDVLYDYKYKLEGELGIEINDLKINVNKILSDCLESINYSLIVKKVENNKNKDKDKDKDKDKKKIYLTIIDEIKR
jgi:hypothetical protein